MCGTAQDAAQRRYRSGATPVWRRAQAHAAPPGHRRLAARQSDGCRNETSSCWALAADGLGQLGLWTTSPVFPQTSDAAVPGIAAATFVPYATAIIVADLVRRRAIATRDDRFVNSGQRQQTSGANYGPGGLDLRHRRLSRAHRLGIDTGSTNAGQLQNGGSRLSCSPWLRERSTPFTWTMRRQVSARLVRCSLAWRLSLIGLFWL